MSFDYGKSQRTAQGLIAKFGQAGIIRRTVTTGNPWEPGGGSTVTDHACTLVSLDYSLRERESTLIEATDRKVLVSTAGLSVEPTPADQVVIGDQVMAIINVMPLRPASTVLMYEMQARA